ncbi:2',3'-cyclic-nucleotide 3'-phosphodiesterase-like [Pollicipes pollicipes]|uniref:2',3'-cyclic-nucleotide 3'-phosphodiesterase-like n=1 Tax=Pollicipes pollicipes TaxID=41117 RepID=UPI001884D61B|nr:2',3'-cyclic-nucleotide 3'-phosphodiesterase-like [Pollicipes pollicipes]
MIGSLTVVLYVVSGCIQRIMGQALTKIKPQWWPSDGQPKPASDGLDECGGKIFTLAKSVHHIAPLENEEIVIKESVVTRAVPVAAAVGHRAAAYPSNGAAPRAGGKRPRDEPSSSDQHEDTSEPLAAQAAGPQPKRRPVHGFETLIKSKDVYPFLDDDETVDYLRTSKVLFVMKGLPGSGKSHLAKRILQRYPDAVLCSADDFFMKDGRYEFERDQLPAAHEACQRRAERACCEQRAHLVVDNTNVRDWEWRPYARLALRHQYVLLLVEPDTPWRRDPARLVQMNSHAVPEEDIRRKLKSLQISIPLYYGWILNAADCQALLDRARLILEKVFRASKAFADDFRAITGSSRISDLSALYPAPPELLHCTARFCGRGRAAGARGYAERVDVRRAVGHRSVARVTGLLLTPRTLGLLRRPLAKVERATLHRVDEQVWYLDLERDIVVDVVFGARY